MNIKSKNVFLGSIFDYRNFVPFMMLLLSQSAFSQSQEIPFDDLSYFKNPGKTWKTVDKVVADLDETNVLRTQNGTGILVNQPQKNNSGKDLFSEEEYGDMNLELDYLMAEGSNSGIYFMGQYELQLEDSWGEQTVTSANNGGIYERWNQENPEGEKGFQGYPPRQNVAKAPGLWQHLEVSFRAPRFNDRGEKIENAKFLKIELNGVTIHENVELLGPTRGAVSTQEKAEGPLRIQGDHGAVAFRDMVVTDYDKPRPELKNLKYAVYEGQFNEVPRFDSLPPEFEGPSVILTSDLKIKSNQFLIRYTGDLKVSEPGEYTFDLSVPGGSGRLRIGEQEIINLKDQNKRVEVDLEKGTVPFELVYSKYEDWAEPGLGLTVAGPGIREYLISDGRGMYEDPVNPILVTARENVLLRSFMDLPVNEESGGYRVTHGISVGTPKKVHYTYDYDKGTIVQLWRGGFLDATPMWYSRGDGSSRPRGAVEHFGVPELTLATLESPKALWPKDTLGSGYRPLGYQLDEQERPVFRYEVHGTEVQDEVRVLDNAHGIQRKIVVSNPATDLYARLAKSGNIEKLSDTLYVIGDKDYYLRINESKGNQPLLRKIDGQQELLVPVQNELIYSILF